MQRAFRYRFYPTPAQESLLARTLGCVRYVYNRALAERSRAWHEEHRNVGYGDTSALLTGWKRDEETIWLNEVSCVPLQQSLRHLQAAFGAFWDKRARYPSFKRKHGHASAEFTRSGFRWRDGRLWLAKCVEPLEIRWSRPLPEGSEPSTITVARDAADRWFVSLLVEDAVLPLPPSEQAVGVDAGITSLVTLSTGEKIDNPCHERRDRHRLARAQRRLSRKQKGSANRTKARKRVARVHARIADRRQDFLHKLSTRLVRENQAVVIEDLNVHGMIRNHRLARAVADASWSELRRMLEYKSEWYGRQLVVVDRWLPSSKTCHDCAAVLAELPLDVRAWTCPCCGVVHDRDVNAARNILAAGLAATACGGDARPDPGVRRGRSPVKQERQRVTAGIPRL